MESNHRPPGYEPEALTKLSYEPEHRIDYNIPLGLCQGVQEMIICLIAVLQDFRHLLIPFKK
ncbi:protein of unknown function [Mesotoga infera]|uniref:Uncharacterized protein n=1 Tax=Mesotoga infera TaxID=1236046 RepID=A0A7Z7PRD8_9BACT|nr:protein of unknown function [Mesotoga infera]